MSINAFVGPLSLASFSSLEYNQVLLSDMGLELADEGTGFFAKLPDKPLLPLSEDAIKNLCKFLEVPYKFSKDLRKKGNSYVLSYLQQQLSKSINSPVTYVVSNEDNNPFIASFTEDKDLSFKGEDGVELDKRMLDTASQNDYPLELMSRQIVNGKVQYFFLHKNEALVKQDPGERGLEPLWRWGYTFSYSLFGNMVAKYGSQVQRMSCSNLTYLPEKIYSKVPAWEYGADLNSKCDTVLNYFTRDLPLPDWKQVDRWVQRLAKVPASVNEVNTVRKRLLKVLQENKEDLDTANRIETTLQWKKIVRGYGLDDKEFKPTNAWKMRASTPLSLFDLYCTLTQEATAAPNTIPWDQRQDLLVYGGKFLAKVPDIAEFPPEIDWN